MFSGAICSFILVIVMVLLSGWLIVHNRPGMVGGSGNFKTNTVKESETQKEPRVLLRRRLVKVIEQTTE